MCDILVVVFTRPYFHRGVASDIVVLNIKKFVCDNTIFLVYRHKCSNPHPREDNDIESYTEYLSAR